MDTLDLATLEKYTEAAQKLQTIMQELTPYVETLKTATLPDDRLVRAGEAAKILGVSPNKIGTFAKAGLLTSFYTDSNQKKFWLSQVRALPKEKPWSIALGGNKRNKLKEVPPPIKRK